MMSALYHMTDSPAARITCEQQTIQGVFGTQLQSHVLSIGDVIIFASLAQLVALRIAITEYLYQDTLKSS